MKRTINTYFNDLMPLYANGRLDPVRRRLLEAWLGRNQEARARLAQLEAIRSSAAVSRGAPSNAVWRRIRTELRAEEPAVIPAHQGAWRMGMALALLLIVLAWFVFPPSIVLEWHAEGAPPAEFHVYRAAPGSQDFVLLDEIPVDDAAREYRFTDLHLIPGRQFTYKIEAVAGDGAALSSQLVVPEAGIALPNQLALFLSLGVMLYGLAVLAINRSRLPGQGLALRPG